MEINEYLDRFNYLRQYDPKHPERAAAINKQQENLFESGITPYDTLEEYRLANSEEMWQYRRMDGEDTGLSVDIFVDDDQAYRVYKHPKWIFFRNSYDKNSRNFLPMLISKNPKIPLRNSSINISLEDVEKIKRFVIMNFSALLMRADAKVSRIYPINEMATLHTYDSGMKVNLWLDDAQHYLQGGHGKRLKFDSGNGPKNTRGYVTLTLPGLKIENEHHLKINNKKLKLAVKFAKLNMDLLDKLADEVIKWKEFLPKVKLPSSANIKTFLNYLQSEGVESEVYTNVENKDVDNPSEQGDIASMEATNQKDQINIYREENIT